MRERLNLDKARAVARRFLRPTSKLGKTTLWFGIVAAVLELWKLLARAPNGTMLSGWATVMSFVFVVCLLLRGMRWARQRMLWRLRNRLIVTYVFIGVIPIILLISMSLLAGYLFAGQFATYVALADLESELQNLVTTNNGLAAQIRALTLQGKLTPQLAAEIATASGEGVNGRTVTVLDGEKGFRIEANGTTVEVQEKLPASAKGDLSNFVMDSGRLQMRALKQMNAGLRRITVISNVPVTADLLQRAARIGSVELYPPSPDSEGEVPKSADSLTAGSK